MWGEPTERPSEDQEMEECLTAWSGLERYTGSAYVIHLLEVIHGLAGLGACIIVGRGASQVLPRATTMRVRFVAPREERVRLTMEQKGLCQEDARNLVDKIDRDRNSFIRSHMHRDPEDPTQYDLVVDVTRWNKEELVELLYVAATTMSRESVAS